MPLTTKPVLEVFIILPNIYGDSSKLYEQILHHKGLSLESKKNESGAIGFYDATRGIQQYFLQLSLANTRSIKSEVDHEFGKSEAEDLVEEIRLALGGMVEPHQELFIEANPGKSEKEISWTSHIILRFIAPSYAASLVDYMLCRRKPESPDLGVFFNFDEKGRHTARYHQISVAYLDPLVELMKYPDLLAKELTDSINEFLRLTEGRVLTTKEELQPHHLSSLKPAFHRLIAYTDAKYRINFQHYLNRLYVHVIPNEDIERILNELKEISRGKDLLVFEAFYSQEILSLCPELSKTFKAYAATHRALVEAGDVSPEFFTLLIDHSKDLIHSCIETGTEDESEGFRLK